MSGGPRWCELFLILYRTPFSTELKVNKTDAVTVCLFRIFIEQIILNTVAKHLVVLTVLEDLCVVIFCQKKQRLIATKDCSGPLRWNIDRSLIQHSGPLSYQLTYYAQLRPLAVCIHREGSKLRKVL